MLSTLIWRPRSTRRCWILLQQEHNLKRSRAAGQYTVQDHEDPRNREDIAVGAKMAIGGIWWHRR